jgi:hypothetical protein
LKLVRFTSQSALLAAGTDKNQIYVKSGELYFQDNSGTNVQITSGGAVNIAGVGGITGLSGTTAAVTYSDILKTFILTQSSGVSAKLDVGRVAIRDEVAAANAVTIKSPSALGANYTLTLPPAVPGTNYGLPYSTTAGVLAFLNMGGANLPLKVNSAGTALEYATLDTAGITNLAITTGKLAANALSADATGLGKMQDGFLSADAGGRAKMADSFVTSGKIAQDIILAGDPAVAAAGQYIVSNLSAADTRLRVIRGSIDGAGAVAYGSGFSASRTGTGHYTITYSGVTWSGPPQVFLSGVSSSDTDVAIAYLYDSSATSFKISVRQGASSPIDRGVDFFVIGPA